MHEALNLVTRMHSRMQFEETNMFKIYFGAKKYLPSEYIHTTIYLSIDR